MSSQPIINVIGNLKLVEILLIDKNEQTIDIKKWLVSLELYDNIGSFQTGKINFNSQFYLREKFPLESKEKIQITWSTAHEDLQKTRTYFISKLSNIEEPKENLSENYSFDIIDEKFLKFLEKEYSYQKHFKQQTTRSMILDIFTHYGYDITFIETTNTELKDYLTYSDDVLDTIQDICYLTKEPFCWFQKENDIIFTSYQALFSQLYAYDLNNLSMIPEMGNFRMNSIKNISKRDILDRKEVSDKGINGFIHFDIDIFNKSFEKNEISLSLTGTKKFEFSETKRNIRTLYSSKYKEDYILMDSLVADMQISSIEFSVGDLVNLNLGRAFSDKTLSFYSGKWLIYSITHKIDVNYIYKQTITLVREKPTLNFS